MNPQPFTAAELRTYARDSFDLAKYRARVARDSVSRRAWWLQGAKSALEHALYWAREHRRLREWS